MVIQKLPLLISLVLIISSTPLLANATVLRSCSTGVGSSPIGVVAHSSDVWFGLDTNNKLADTPNYTCSPTYKSVTNGAHFLEYAGNGYIAYTLKGSGGSSNSCISAYNPSTNTVVSHVCAAGKGFDDIAADPNDSNKVWVSAYYSAQIAHYDVTNGAITYYSVPKPSGCSFTSANPEGLRVDTFGNVWVADEACTRLDEYNTGYGFWGTYTVNGEAPWFLAMDNTNLNVWMTSRQYNDVQYMSLSGGTTNIVHSPSPSGNPTGIDIDPADHRVGVTFQNIGKVNEYFFVTPKTWLCGSSGGDSFGSSTANPFGIRMVSPNYYWVALQGIDKIAEGSC